MSAYTPSTTVHVALTNLTRASMSAEREAFCQTILRTTPLHTLTNTLYLAVVQSV